MQLLLVSRMLVLSPPRQPFELLTDAQPPGYRFLKEPGRFRAI